MVMSVVVWAIRLGVVRRRQYCHLVSVNGVVSEEQLHLSCYLQTVSSVLPSHISDRLSVGLTLRHISDKFFLHICPLKIIP